MTVCFFEYSNVSLNKSHLARIDVRILKSGAVGGLKARRERGFDTLIKADGCTNREDIDDFWEPLLHNDVVQASASSLGER